MPSERSEHGVSDILTSDNLRWPSECPLPTVHRLWRWLRGGCPCRPYVDAGGCGGQCIECGRVVGYLTDAELREWCDG